MAYITQCQLHLHPCFSILDIIDAYVNHTPIQVHLLAYANIMRQLHSAPPAEGAAKYVGYA